MWFRVDDKFPGHKKLRRLEGVHIGVWLVGACWSAQHEEDGRLPREIAYQIALRWDPRARSSLMDQEPQVLSELVAARLWRRTKTGYLIHHFLEYNPSHAALELKRKSAMARYRKGRKPSGDGLSTQSSSQRLRAKGMRKHTKDSITRPDPTRSVPIRSVPIPSPGTTGDKDVSAVARLVDLFRAIPGVTPRTNDGGLIAGLVTRHGAEHVETVIRDADMSIGAATNPLQYLAGACRRPRLVKPAAPPKERAWLDEVDTPDLTPEQLEANQVRIRGLVAEAMGKMS